MRKHIITGLLAGAASLMALAGGYNIVVTTLDGEKHVFDSEKVEKVTFTNAQEWVEVNELISAQYASSKGLGVYELFVGNAEPDSNGDPVGVGDLQLALNFTAATAEDVNNAILPEGEYTIGNGTQEGTFDVQRSGVYLRIAEGADGVEAMPIIAGNVKVSYAMGDYTIEASVVTLQGAALNLRYAGPIGFEPAVGEASPFENDLDMTFEGAQMRFYGNWYYPFADDLTLQFYTGTFDDESGAQLEGYWFNIELNMPKVVDPTSTSITVADGVYNVEWREKAENYTWMPFTYVAGCMVDVFGVESPAHTYIVHRSATTGQSLGFITGGTITVTDNGRNFAFDLEMSNGKKLTGKYTGAVNCFNFNQDELPEMDMLSENVELEWVPGTVAIGYNNGATIVEGVNTFDVMITDSQMENGDYLNLSLLTDKEELADGTYTIGEFKNFGGVKGHLDFGGGLIYSWYGDLSSLSPEGYHEVLAPVTGGTVTVTTINADIRKFDFNLVTLKGWTIKGTFQGYYLDATNYEEPAAAAAAKKMEHKPLKTTKVLTPAILKSEKAENLRLK